MAGMLKAPKAKNGKHVSILLMEAMLARLSGLEAQSVEHPAEGLRLAQRDPPDLILLDIQLPGIDGFEVFARL
jgi:CheY-like chemotaxis protein